MLQQELESMELQHVELQATSEVGDTSELGKYQARVCIK